MSGRQPTVVVAVVDALRRDYLDEETAPHLRSLANRGVAFENAFAATNMTDPSLTSFYTGTFPRTTGHLNHGSNVTPPERVALEDAVFIQERLRAHGYETGAVDWLGRWHRRGYDYYSGALSDRDTSGQGGGRDDAIGRLIRSTVELSPPWLFERVRNAVHRVRPPSVQPGNWLPDTAADVVDAGLDWFDGAGDPAYLFLHFWDTHAPYEVPGEYVDRFGTHDDPVARYRAAIAYVDDQLARLESELAERGHDDVLFVVMGDHGESFGEHGIYFDHHGLYDQSLHVPVVVAHPDLPAGRRVEEFVQHVDLAPTILDFLGLDVPDVDGRSLLPVVSGDAEGRPLVFAEEAQTQRRACARTDRHKYVRALEADPTCRSCHVVHGAREELYDLDADPGETENVISERQDVAQRLRDHLTGWLRAREDERDAIRRAVGAKVADGTFQVGDG